MPVEPVQGLRGLPGLNRISDEERRAFMLSNAEKLKGYRNPRTRRRAAEIMYDNQQFINKFGQEAFNQMNDGSKESYEARNNMLREKVVGDAVQARFSPFVNGKRDNNRGLGKEWENYSGMSVDAWQKLLESDYKTPEQLRREQSQRTGVVDKVVDFFAGEAIQQYKKDSNQKILDRIYSEDADNAGEKLGSQISAAYLDTSVTGRTDNETIDLFAKAITPGSYVNNRGLPNIGIPEFAAHYGKGAKGDITSEMEDFTIDDMRKILAKKAVYEEYMSPQMAATALNNEAKRYIKAHQSGLKRFGLFAKDVGISALSYTADKFNGIYNLGLMAADWIGGDKPIVYVDDAGEVLSLNDKRIAKGPRGNLGYVDKDGRFRTVHREQVDRAALHNMGKNLDGSDDDSWLNPEYWTRAEQFGTLDEDEQRQYEKLGTSPYKVAYDPNEDTDLWYESFKMMSFGLADAASMLIPFGVGLGGRVLSTASKVGKAGRGLGKALDTGSKYLTAQTKIGSAIQGSTGALGIAYAYQRNAFQEMLAQNLANAEKAVVDRSKNEVYNRYQRDKSYKKQIDSLVDARAAEMKAAYIANMGRDNGNQVFDEAALDKMIRARAQDEVLAGFVQRRASEIKSSDEYAALQQEAINSTGEAANTIFIPEAIKYGLVNTIGFRKFLYTNPSSVIQKASKNFAALTEKTIDGKKRLDVASKFTTIGGKMKKLGRIAGSQAWGGIWTNGTDDMMVDAAERINEDSFSRYVQSFENGQNMADTYSLADGLYSYWKGLNNSLGQETTWNAAAVGGLGSIVSASPNMANIVHLMTKEGREGYKAKYQERPVFENGKYKRDKDGKIETEDVKRSSNWLERLSFFVQNGVLNNYYAAKENERSMQYHADFVNNILDDYEDFKALEELVASNRAVGETESLGDEKTAKFVSALKTLETLDVLGNDAKDPTTLSSVVQGHKTLIDRIAQLGEENAENQLSEEEINNLVAQYYKQNNVPQNEQNNEKAIEIIKKNAQELKEAKEIYDSAEQDMQDAEELNGKNIDPSVRRKMKLSHSLQEHWTKRRDSMMSEIGDVSEEGEISQEDLISSIGGKQGAVAMAKIYARQEEEIEEAQNAYQNVVTKMTKEYETAKKNLEKVKGTEGELQAFFALAQAKSKLENAQMQESFLNDLKQNTENRRKNIEEALEAQKDAPVKTLTADEIFALDPITRAKMMDKRNRNFYTKKQQLEIEKLEKRLVNEKGGTSALQKIQDIALLTNRINTSKDAYHRMLLNPEAAAEQLEQERAEAATQAYKLINRLNAQIAADYVDEVQEALKRRKGVTSEFLNDFVFRTLRKLNSNILDVLDNEDLLPEYQKQINEAKGWGKVLDNISSVINSINESPEWKRNMLRNIDGIVERSNTPEEIMTNLEKVLDTERGEEGIDLSRVRNDFERLLKGMEQLGHLRDATVIESRKQRQEREKENKERDQKAKEKLDKSKEEIKDQAQKDKEKQKEKKSEDAEPDFASMEVQSLEDVDIFDESDKEESSEPKTPKTPSDLLSDDFESGTIEVGTIWVGEGKNATEQILQVKKSTETAETPIITFSAGKEKVTLLISPEENLLEDYQQKKDGVQLPFEVNSLKKAEAKWYFVGTFAGQDKKTVIPIKKGFDLDAAIEEEKTRRELSLAADGVNVGKFEKDGEGNLILESPSVETQISEVKDVKSNQLQDISKAESYEENNEVGLDAVEKRAGTLSGNAMSEYVITSLSNGGVLVKKPDGRRNGSRTKYRAWMKSFVDENGVRGTKLQDIIDNEMHQILEANPNTPIKFMAINRSNNATHDGDMKSHLMLVVDYNADVERVHNKENGGVIKSAGKKYLIVGVVGYGPQIESERKTNTGRIGLYNILYSNNPHLDTGYGLVTRGIKKFFDEHPEERFYVPENLSTEVIPNSLISGFIVKALNEEMPVKPRSILEILESEDMNPEHLELGELAWGIQTKDKFWTTDTQGREVMRPKDTEPGRAFVLIPSGNGKVVPSYLFPVKYKELNNGALKEEIDEALTQLTAPGGKELYAERYKALSKLLHIFHISKDKDMILLYDKKPVITLKKEGENRKEWSFNLESPDFDSAKFIKAFNEFNPRVNINAQVLSNESQLKKYAEAGALSTDIARLYTGGVSYSIYPIGADGKIDKTLQTVSNTQQDTPEGQYKKKSIRQLPYRGNYYDYDSNSDTFTKKGAKEPIKDANTIKELRVNLQILEGKLKPVKMSKSQKYYVLKTGEHPEVVKVNPDYKVSWLTEKASKDFIKEIERDKAERSRDLAAEAALENFTITEVEDIPIDDMAIEGLYDGYEPPLPDGYVQEKPKKEKKVTPVPKKKPASVTGSTQNFETLMKKRSFKKRVYQIIQKWEDSPIKTDKKGRILGEVTAKELADFINKKGGKVQALGTSQEAVEAWLKTLEECRV